MSTEYLNELGAAAESFTQEETTYRQESQKRLAAMADRRARAYRRFNLIREMVELARAVSDQAACVAAQCSGILADAGWSESDAAYREVGDALGRLALLIHADLHGSTGAARNEKTSVPATLDAFETWYRARFGSEFPALHPRDAPTFQSLVDF